MSFKKVHKKLFKKSNTFNQKIIFMHLPKCGGTSTREALRKLYGRRVFDINANKSRQTCELLSNGSDNLQNFRTQLTYYQGISGKYNYISGHFQCNDVLLEQLTPSYDFITILREPISRFISHYFYNRYKEHGHFKIEDDIEEFIDSDEAKKMGNFYLNQLTGPYNQSKNDKALRNLAKFSIVGFLDDLDTFLGDFKSKYNQNLVIPKRNINPKNENDQQNILSDKILYKIENICKEDLLFYSDAKKICYKKGQN